MEAPVIAAVVAGSVAAVGWVVNYVLSSRQAEGRRRLEARLKFVERQIEELYGPMAFLLFEGRRAFEDLLEVLGRRFVFSGNDPLPEGELKTWLFWVEAEFLPRNAKIVELLRSKAQLIEGPKFPDSFGLFLEHANSWATLHRRWKDEKVPYAWRSKVNWPTRFETEVLEMFAELKDRHSALLGAIAGGPRAGIE